MATRAGKLHSDVSCVRTYSACCVFVALRAAAGCGKQCAPAAVWPPKAAAAAGAAFNEVRVHVCMHMQRAAGVAKWTGMD